MFKDATVHLGISAFEFYELTYRELHMMLDTYWKKKKEDLELLSKVVQIGYVNGKAGKNYKLFNDESDDVTFINPEVKKKTLNELKGQFSK